MKNFKNFRIAPKFFFALQYIKNWTKVVPWKIFFCSWKKKLLVWKKFFWNFMKWGLKGGISIYADSGPPRYVLWCCGCICHEVLTFIQIGCGHTVGYQLIFFLLYFFSEEPICLTISQIRPIHAPSQSLSKTSIYFYIHWQKTHHLYVNLFLSLWSIEVPKYSIPTAGP